MLSYWRGLPLLPSPIMKMPQKRTVIAGCFVLTLIPIPYLAVPDWIVRVVDALGKPVPGITVRLEYINYSVESSSHEEDQVTDQSGFVHFQSRRGWAPTIQRIYYTSASAMALAHASFGPNDYVFAFGKGFEGNVVEDGLLYSWNGGPGKLKSNIIVTPMKE